MPPVNDDFANAQDLGSDSGTLTFSNVGATVEPTEPNASFILHTVWFKWTPTADGQASVRTGLTPLPDWDTYIDVFTGTSLVDLVEVTSDDDGDFQAGHTDTFGTSKATWACAAGTTYWIQVGVFDDVSGPAERSDARVDWTWSPPPDPDPVLSTRSPVQGIAGTIVDLHGSNLDTINHVRFGSADASFTVIDATHVQATVPVTHAPSSTVSVVTDTALNPVSSLAFTVLFPGRWTSLPERFGNPVVPVGAWRFSARDWPGSGWAPPADITGPPDSSVSGGTVSNGTAQASVNVSAGGTTPASSPGDVQVRQSVALVDVQAVWDNDPGGADYPLYTAMDPHPDADVPALPTDAVTYEWQHPTVTVGTIPDGAVVFAGRYRFYVYANSPGLGSADTSPLHVDLRRVPAGSYTEEPIGSSTPLVAGWIFPAALAALVSLATYPVTVYTGSGPIEATTYDLADSDLDTGRIHAMVVTHTEYIAGSPYSAADNTNDGVFEVRIAFRYTPDRYRFLYTSPQLKPPQRQYPRDDGLGISTRRSWPPPTSKQYGMRRGPTATYW